MGIEHKKNVGTYLGPQEKHQKEAPKSDNKSGNGSFKSGAILKGLPSHEPESYPEAPHNPQGLQFQDMRDQDSAPGTI